MACCKRGHSCKPAQLCLSGAAVSAHQVCLVGSPSVYRVPAITECCTQISRSSLTGQTSKWREEGGLFSHDGSVTLKRRLMLLGVALPNLPPRPQSRDQLGPGRGGCRRCSRWHTWAHFPVAVFPQREAVEPPQPRIAHCSLVGGTFSLVKSHSVCFSSSSLPTPSPLQCFPRALHGRPALRIDGAV